MQGCEFRTGIANAPMVVIRYFDGFASRRVLLELHSNAEKALSGDQKWGCPGQSFVESRAR